MSTGRHSRNLKSFPHFYRLQAIIIQLFLVIHVPNLIIGCLCTAVLGLSIHREVEWRSKEEDAGNRE